MLVVFLKIAKSIFVFSPPFLEGGTQLLLIAWRSPDDEGYLSPDSGITGGIRSKPSVYWDELTAEGMLELGFIAPAFKACYKTLRLNGRDRV
jgi:hypothetical protein